MNPERLFGGSPIRMSPALPNFPLQMALCLLAGCTASTATRTMTFGAGGAERTAVYSRASKDYVRVQNPDGSFKPESYMFKDGGNFGGPRVDVTMDRMSFDDVSRVITPPLAKLNYVPSEDPAATNLLIVVYWGTTVVPDDIYPHSVRRSSKAAAKAAADVPNSISQQMDERELQALYYSEELQDGQINANNANILGYTDEIFRSSPRDPNLSTLQEELEHDRYYVVLLAYDYPFARRYGLHRLLWETRFSIPETGNDFEKEFPKMATIAAQFFGQDSHGLIHHNLADTHVEIGEPKSLGTVPEK
jgi:hypothetical protein